LYHWFLLLDRFHFCETRFTTHQRFVSDQSAISPFLGGYGISCKSAPFVPNRGGCIKPRNTLKQKIAGNFKIEPGSKGWELKGQERKKKDIWIASQVNHVLTGRFCCYWCSTLFNYNRYSCIGAFFDFIEWLKVWFTDLYLYLIFCKSTISRFWICCLWSFSFLMEGIFFEDPSVVHVH